MTGAIIGLALGIAWVAVIETIRLMTRGATIKPTPLTELASLVIQERANQMIPLAGVVSLNMPVDVKKVTLTLHYDDGARIAVDIWQPIRVGAQGEL